jgi:hypothetical protein
MFWVSKRAYEDLKVQNDKLWGTVTMLMGDLREAQEEIARTRLTLVNSPSGEVFVPTPDVPRKEDFGTVLSAEIEEFIAELDGEEAQAAVREQAMAMVASGRSQFDTLNAIVYGGDDAV